MIKFSIGDQEHEVKLDQLCGALQVMGQEVDFSTLAAEVDRIATRPDRKWGYSSPLSTELMIWAPLIPQSFNLSDEQMEFQLLNPLSFQHFAGMRSSGQVSIRVTIWIFKEWLMQADAYGGFCETVNLQLAKHVYMAHGAQIIKRSLIRITKNRFL